MPLRKRVLFLRAAGLAGFWPRVHISASVATENAGGRSPIPSVKSGPAPAKNGPGGARCGGPPRQALEPMRSKSQVGGFAAHSVRALVVMLLRGVNAAQKQIGTCERSLAPCRPCKEVPFARGLLTQERFTMRPPQGRPCIGKTSVFDPKRLKSLWKSWKTVLKW